MQGISYINEKWYAFLMLSKNVILVGYQIKIGKQFLPKFAFKINEIACKTLSFKIKFFAHKSFVTWGCLNPGVGYLDLHKCVLNQSWMYCVANQCCYLWRIYESRQFYQHSRSRNDLKHFFLWREESNQHPSVQVTTINCVLNMCNSS